MADPTYDFDLDEVIARERGWWIQDGERSTATHQRVAAELCAWMEHHNPKWRNPSKPPERVTGKELDRRILEERRPRRINNRTA